MPQLLEDIVRIIMEIIYHADINPPWAALANLSLVCETWRGCAEALLYASVQIQNPRQLRAFLGATDPSTPRGLHLGSAVRILKVTIYPVAYVTRVVSNRLPELLARCPKLYELRIVLEEMEGWAPETLEELRKTSPPILALRLRDGMERGDAARKLLHVWPSVRHLAIRSSSIDRFEPNKDEPPLQFTLFELRWENMHPPTTQFLLWLLNYDLASSRHSFLRILHLSAFPADDAGGLSVHYGPHLHSFRAPHTDPELIESARRLKEIYLFDCRGVTVEFLLMLSPSIEHIAFGIMHGTYALEHIFQVKGNGVALENLKVISLHRQIDQNWPKHWDMLEARAKSLNIALIRQEGRGFLVGGTEDLIAPSRYPRPSTTRQFDRMASAVDALPSAYIDPDEEVMAPPPPPKISFGDPATPSTPEGSITHLPHASAYSRSTPQSQLSFGRQTIRLDESVPYPRPWDHENDRPLGPIRLDDPPIGNTGRRGNMWRVARTALAKVKIKVGGAGRWPSG